MDHGLVQVTAAAVSRTQVYDATSVALSLNTTDADVALVGGRADDNRYRRRGVVDDTV